MEETGKRVRSIFERIYGRNPEWIGMEFRKKLGMNWAETVTEEGTGEEFMEETEEEPGKELSRNCIKWIRELHERNW